MTDVIRRKIDRARPTQAEGAPGADRGWRLALARAARDAMGLDLEFRSLAIARQSLAEILEQAPDLALIALLDGPRGGLGVIMLAPTVTASFIEKQTLGRLGQQSPPPRRASRIDAAMVAGVIDRALVGLDETLAEEADFSWAGGFRYSSYLEDARPLGLLLEEDAYRVLSAEVALGMEGRTGRVLLVLPAIGRGEVPQIAEDEVDAEAPHFTSALSAQVMQADCRLDAVIGRLTLPLRQIMTLQAGETLLLPRAALDSISLETIEGRHVAGARLGQHRGMRALKLNEAVSKQRAGAPISAGPATTADPPPAELRAAG
ncbi:FliM/FliN family flagellar motor switch protein [Tabrizicola sp.]|uniref:FliM/FliN family flagellar motor switch protein n=1 Tax=Tabrizicola sp. TaxID=2005166 RepID=UPI002733800A|nr:FliM/FliN family flagellar motor switch protein [Tabrizicola sp.]MDP3195755.1 FliM/FliN family flagellar motor switch protein [Tabrizicola sp.]